MKDGKNMTVLDDLFVHNNVGDLTIVIRFLELNIPTKNLYCIVYNKNQKRIDIVHSKVLFASRGLKIYEEYGVIIGVAYFKNNAMQLVSYMAKNCIDNNKDLNVLTNWFA